MAGLQPQCKVFPHNALLASQRVDPNRIARTKKSKRLKHDGFYIETRRIFKEKMVVYHSVIISQKTSGQAVAKKTSGTNKKQARFGL